MYATRFDEVLKFCVNGLAPVRQEGQAWHIRHDGSAAYARRFIRCFGFYDGLAAVVAADGWHHITVTGEDAYSERYAWCGNFQASRCTVRDFQGKYYHIKQDGRRTYTELWNYAGDYRDGIAVVQTANGLSTHIDRDGKLTHGRWYIDLDVFHKGFARAREEEGWTHIGTDGQPAYARRFASVEPFYNGQARVERPDGALEVIDEAGNVVVELRPPRRSEFASLSGDMVGFWRTQTIATAVQLQIIEALPATATEISNRCNIRKHKAWRFLRALEELGLVRQEDTRWVSTDRGNFLRPDHPMTLADAALEYAGPFSEMWKDLPRALRGDSTWIAPDIFSEVACDAARRVGHHRMLQSYARHDYADVCRALDLRGNERIVDAGGGLGVLAGMVLQAHPRARITILERPEVVALAAPHHPDVNWLAANIFEPWGISADVVLLSRVLHDWEDDVARRILANARRALPVGGHVFIIEMVIPEDRAAGALCDLHLLMATGGKERPATEFHSLLTATGFTLHSTQALPALPSVIVGVAT